VAVLSLSTAWCGGVVVQVCVTLLSLSTTWCGVPGMRGTILKYYMVWWSRYAWGIHAPGMKDMGVALKCGHQVLLAHAAAVAVYRGLEGAISGGRITIVINSDWSEPLTQEAPGTCSQQLHTHERHQVHAHNSHILMRGTRYMLTTATYS
jgi:beta-glucosidase/6-phospho-beta-glucosidase/beta-galactosidase